MVEHADKNKVVECLQLTNGLLEEVKVLLQELIDKP